MRKILLFWVVSCIGRVLSVPHAKVDERLALQDREAVAHSIFGQRHRHLLPDFFKSLERALAKPINFNRYLPILGNFPGTLVFGDDISVLVSEVVPVNPGIGLPFIDLHMVSTEQMAGTPFAGTPVFVKVSQDAIHEVELAMALQAGTGGHPHIMRVLAWHAEHAKVLPGAAAPLLIEYLESYVQLVELDPAAYGKRPEDMEEDMTRYEDYMYADARKTRILPSFLPS